LNSRPLPYQGRRDFPKPVIIQALPASSKPGEGDIDPARDHAFGYLWDGVWLKQGLQHVKSIILATDGDQKGRVLREELANLQGGRMNSVTEATLYDINGGAVWNNKADIGVIVWADNIDTPDRHIKIAKSKDFVRFGKPGMARMRFDPLRSIYTVI
jgi:hypothetical protein